MAQPVFETYSAIATNIWFNGKNTKHQTDDRKLQYEKWVSVYLRPVAVRRAKWPIR